MKPINKGLFAYLMFVIAMTILFIGITSIMFGCESKSRQRIERGNLGTPEKCVILSINNYQKKSRAFKLYRIKRISDSTVFNRTYPLSVYYEKNDTIMIKFWD